MSDAPSPAADPAPISLTTFIAHRRMVLCLFFSTLVIVGIFSRYLTRNNPPPSFLIAIALSGSLGGFLSALRRFYAFDGTGSAPPTVRFFGKSYTYVVIYSLIPPLVGAIGAVLVYTVLAAQMIKSGMFPNFLRHPDNCIEGQYVHFQDFIYNWKPAESIDFAKALVWAFISGFSERFVPDLLTKLTGDVGK